MHPETNNFTISRDVVFDEASSYYSKCGATVGSVNDKIHVNIKPKSVGGLAGDTQCTQVGEQCERGSDIVYDRQHGQLDDNYAVEEASVP